MQNNKISIVVPTYREAENVDILTRRIHKTMTEYNILYEIIFVDDNSQDDIEKIISNLSVEGFNVLLVQRKNKRGLSTAVLRGFSEAEGGILVCMDADLSHPPEIIHVMINKIVKDNAEFVIGSRYVNGGSTDHKWTIYRRINSKIAALFAKPFTTAKDPMSGFFAIPDRVYKRGSCFNPIGYKIALELIVRCKCEKIVEVPIYFSERKFGESKLTLKEQLNYLVHIKRLISHKLKHLMR
jgi:dolichol-phosphate mannosyltransferase